MPALCRDCLRVFDAGARCPGCRSPRIVAHPELFELPIAHMDCDAFYASVEKRDNPELRDLPVIDRGRQDAVAADGLKGDGRDRDGDADEQQRRELAPAEGEHEPPIAAGAQRHVGDTGGGEKRGEKREANLRGVCNQR